MTVFSDIDIAPNFDSFVAAWKNLSEGFASPQNISLNVVVLSLI